MNKSKNYIAFLLNDKLVTIHFKESGVLFPTTTVLKYLRNHSFLHGVKEGCSEGDCGACTVVIGELNGENKITYKAVDSCLMFLPMLHGKQLITIEHLANRINNKVFLHPVQQSMVDNYGVQCGFCTPGITMSLFALFKNHNNPSVEIISDALTGNLCRCTGYKSIIDSARSACANHGEDKFTEWEEKTAEILKHINQTTKTLSITENKINYFRPAKLKKALFLKHKHQGAVLIGGATDVALKVTKANQILNEIIDLSGIACIKYYNEKTNTIHIGAGICLESLKNLTEKSVPALHHMLCYFGSKQIRNLATLGGNIGSASPIGDTLPVLMAYNTSIVLESIEKKRIVNINDFIKGYRKTDIRPDEIITGIILPKQKAGMIIKSYKISKRKNLDISTVSACFALQLNKENVVRSVVLAYGGVASVTKRAIEAENFITGKKWTYETIEKASKIVYKEFTPITDARAGELMRRIVARNLLIKFFSDTMIK